MAINIERKKVALEVKPSNLIEPFQSSSYKIETEDAEQQNKLGTEEEKPIKKVLNKFHLPVLNINKPEYWDSMPNQERKHFTSQVAMETCLGNCCGYEGLKGGCCQIDPEDLEHVLGQVTEEDVKKIINHLKKTTPGIKREDIVIDKDEGMKIGKQFFNDHPVFSHIDSYPMLRFQIFGPRFVCKFLSTKTFMCTIYNYRPKMCQNYYCEFLKKNYLLKTKDKPNTWQKLK
jgi:Fe-S-cluster containining protein